jgi:phosphoribosylamine---glycine ligase
VQVVVVGSGAREHALAWRIAQSPALTELHAAPGNPGIAEIGHCHPVRAEDSDGLLSLAQTLQADLVVVGPEGPLVAGLGDVLRRNGIAVFGPSAAAARIEGSKSFAKDVLQSAGVPTAQTLAVARAPCVVKADGLASGKGVFVCRTHEELAAALPAATALGQPLVVEELLEGREVSVFALCDGEHAIPLPPAQDFKRAFDGDEGPNTGGMGSYASAPDVDVQELVEAIHRPVLEELARRGSPFIGVLFAGLILTETGPHVLEFNCRFGDPETQSLMPLLDDALLDALAACAAGDARHFELRAADDAAVTVVLAASSYPAAGDVGSPIAGVEQAEAAGAHVFHAGTALHDDTLVTNGGRILGVTATGATVTAARDRAYEAASLASFDGARCRTDVAREAAAVA